MIDEQRGYGIAGETHNAFEQLVELGAPDWFRLGDRDLATCLLRTELLHEGRRLTEIARQLAAAFGVGAAVLPMCDEPVQTYVRTEGEWRHFQEYLILQHSEPAIEGVEFRGAEQARVTRGGPARARGGGGDRDRPLEPDREHRPDPRRARACGRRSRRGRARRRRQPAGRRPLAQGTDGAFMRVGRARGQRRAASPRTTRA